MLIFIGLGTTGATFGKADMVLVGRFGVKITPSGGGKTTPGPPDWFTGDVYIDWIRDADEQSSLACLHVRFCPGARTAWHSHPKGQTLYVTDGIGRVCYRGGKPVEIRPGDVVWTEPNEEHWHGATADRFMAHVAVYQADEQGQTATWLDHVTADEYGQVH